MILKFVALTFVITLIVLELVLKKPEGAEESRSSHISAETGSSSRELYTGAESSEREEKHWKMPLLTLWCSYHPVEIEFAYQPDVDEEWHAVELSMIQQDADDGQIYFIGTCKARCEARTFDTSRIVTKIAHAGAKYSIEEFITDKLSPEQSAA